MALELVLPVPPSVNNWKTPARNGRGMVKSAEFRRYTLAVRLRTGGIKPLLGPVAMTVRWFRARKAGDLDGRLKALCDALNGIAWEDDSQIAELHAYRFEDPKNPRVEVTIVEQMSVEKIEAFYSRAPMIELEG